MAFKECLGFKCAITIWKSKEDHLEWGKGQQQTNRSLFISQLEGGEREGQCSHLAAQIHACVLHLLGMLGAPVRPPLEGWWECGRWQLCFIGFWCYGDSCVMEHLVLGLAALGCHEALFTGLYCICFGSLIQYNFVSSNYYCCCWHNNFCPGKRVTRNHFWPCISGPRIELGLWFRWL